MSSVKLQKKSSILRVAKHIMVKDETKKVQRKKGIAFSFKYIQYTYTHLFFILGNNIL